MRNLLLTAALVACHASPPVEGADTDAPVATTCADGTPIVPWNADGPYGTHRHELARDLSLPRADGTTWRLSEAWDGCSSFVFLPDSLAVSALDDTSVWEADLGALVKASPDSAVYVFVSTQRDEAARAAIDGMQARIDKLVDHLDADAGWRDRLIVADRPTGEIESWLGELVDHGIGRSGFAIDRFQQLRGVGQLADVTRFDAALQSAGQWPWEANLAYAAYEVEHFDVEAAVQARLATEDATIVSLFSGEVLDQGFAEVDATLPSAAELAAFDTLEIDVDMRCPDPEKTEFGNCGAWDYLAYLWVQADDDSWIELGRFITSYHRETRWVVDVTPMIVHLLQGGTRHFKWEWAPPWNTQPTETRVSLRFSDQGRGVRPVSVTKLFTGGDFGSAYNTGREPVAVPIASTAAKVELWALITGHGSGTNQCAEFCNHQHAFTVAGHEHLQQYPMVGDDEGCIARIADQMTPNQGGTWWFGRGGWCPGAPVLPYVVDVTGEVTAGADATIGYEGRFDGGPPPDGSGNIVMNSWLVVYE